MRKLLPFVLASTLCACGNSSAPTPDKIQPVANQPEPTQPEPTQPAPTEKSPDPIKFDFKNLQEALAVATPEMGDIQGDGISKGAAILALWGADAMKWNELQAVPAGKYGMVMKDPDSQRGARICTSGRVIEIHVENTTPKKVFLGGMYDDAGHLYRFIAVGSTGEIVANSYAKFCGIVTGQQHYQNSAGGIAHSVYMVGMFDLPGNKLR